MLFEHRKTKPLDVGCCTFNLVNGTARQYTLDDDPRCYGNIAIFVSQFSLSIQENSTPSYYKRSLMIASSFLLPRLKALGISKVTAAENFSKAMTTLS